MAEGDAVSNAGRNEPTMLVFCPDVMFASRLQNLARHTGVKATMVRPGQALGRGDLMVASFGGGGGWDQAIREATEAGIPVIAFGPHVAVEDRRKARAAGAYRVVANGNLDRALLPVLQEMAAGDGTGEALEAVHDPEMDEPHEHQGG